MYKYLIKKKQVIEEDTCPHIIDVGGSTSILGPGLIRPRKPAREKKPERPINEVLPEWFNSDILKDLGHIEVKKVRVIISTDNFGIVELRYNEFEGYIVASTDLSKHIDELETFFTISGCSVYKMRTEDRRNRCTRKLIIQPKITTPEEPEININEDNEDGGAGDYSGLGYLFT